MVKSNYEVAVIGAGHAGLAASWFLKKYNIDHVVLEKGKVGETWRSQRWDSFALNTPNDLNVLPGDTCTGPPGEFPLASGLVRQFESYVAKFKLPVVEHAVVTALHQNVTDNEFAIHVTVDGKQVAIQADQVIICSGSQNVPVIPAIADAIHPDITQLHGAAYRNEKQLPPGHVLVIGSGQTGVQVAEDLLDHHRKVYLSTSRVGRLPRRYRGKDIMYWILDAGMFDVTPDMVKDPALFETRTPQVSGTGKFGHTVSLQSLAKKGAVILGKLTGAAGDVMTFAPNAKEHVAFGDSTSAQTKAAVEQYIMQQGIPALPHEPDVADDPDTEGKAASDMTSLALSAASITSIIWCSGFTGDYRYLSLPVLNEKGLPLHRDGISPIRGLYFLGIYWLRKRKSGIIAGITDDARFIVNEIMNQRASNP